ncbi:uncharacterized protein LOC117647204 [Thrips palmi]|uniref:Uncharacterized protein LOC117647204 n=1 Tax=Thrips palmi TaxID=161013 RepID=A0A6P8Z3T6_THRPL|nr:uncharacterized protein LOC117647204 [Thrips palmi]
MADGGEGPEPPRPVIRIQQPDPFNWNAEEWPAWSTRFLRYRRLSKLDKDAPATQLDVLLYLMGEKADIAMKTFRYAPTESNENVLHVMDKFTEYFGGKINVIYERAKFNQRSQRAGESASDFITDLYSMAEKCNYGELREELIRDRIIVGISNVQLSAAMQMDATIDLAKVRERVLQAEDVGKQLPVLRNGHGDAAQAQINFVRKSKKPFTKPKSHTNAPLPNQDKSRKPAANQSRQSKQPKPCKKCARTPSHPYSQCPAKDSICGRCKNKGHWAVACFTVINEATAEDQPHAEEVTYYLDCVSADLRGKSLRVDITSNGTPVRWKIDSGADIPIIGDKTVDVLKPEDVLDPGVKVMLAGQVQANVTGKCQIRLEWKQRVYDIWAYVIPDQKEPLLSRCLALEMGLIKLAPEPTKNAIEELLQLDAIEPVTEPSLWCAPLVPVPKPDGTVRLTIDYTALNEYVLRECFEMPTVDESQQPLGLMQRFSANWMLSGGTGR